MMYEWGKPIDTHAVFVKAISDPFLCLLGSQVEDLASFAQSTCYHLVANSSWSTKSLLLVLACHLCFVLLHMSLNLVSTWSLYRCLLHVYHFLACPSEDWLPSHCPHRISFTLTTCTSLMAICSGIDRQMMNICLQNRRHFTYPWKTNSKMTDV